MTDLHAYVVEVQEGMYDPPNINQDALFWTEEEAWEHAQELFADVASRWSRYDLPEIIHDADKQETFATEAFDLTGAGSDEPEAGTTMAEHLRGVIEGFRLLRERANTDPDEHLSYPSVTVKRYRLVPE